MKQTYFKTRSGYLAPNLRLPFIIFVALVIFSSFQKLEAQSLWINEIHYDNSGTDKDEFVEIAGPAGFDLTGYSLVLYNGSNGSPYKTELLDGFTLSEIQFKIGTICIPIKGIQNGAPDGIAIVGPDSQVIQFISYEGVLLASSGPALGMESIDIGVSQSSATPGTSLALSGKGGQYSDFTWMEGGVSTCGTVNSGQEFTEFQTIENCFPAKVIDFQQGRKKWFQWVPKNRSKPEKALGKPQENDYYNFVSLGFGGSITLELESPLQDDGTFKPDFIIVETSFGKADNMCYENGSRVYPESVIVEISENGIQWFAVPNTYCRTSFIDLSPVINNHPISEVNYIRITDDSDRRRFGWNADGFDLDGLILCSQEVDLAIQQFLDARTLSGGIFDPSFINMAPDEEGDLKVKVYPNPVYSSGLLNLEFYANPADGKVGSVKIFDMTGKLKQEKQIFLNPGRNQIKMVLKPDISSGQYLLNVSTDQQNDVKQINVMN